MTDDKPVLDRALREEADFANIDYAPYANDVAISPGMMQRYRAPHDLHDWRQMSAVLLGDLAGKDVLDYGCGLGEEAVYFARLGARVTGIDISEVGIASLRRRAEHHGLPITAFEMRCDAMTFPDRSFDRVHGLGILHHVGIEAGLREVWRVLRPGGIGVFLEPLGDCPALEAAKAFVMRYARFLGEFDRVSDHERNLTWREIDDAVHRFGDASVYPYHLLYRLKRLLPARALDRVRRIDFGVLTMVPQLRRYAGAVVIRVRKQDFRTTRDLMAIARRLEPDRRLIEHQLPITHDVALRP